MIFFYVLVYYLLIKCEVYVETSITKQVCIDNDHLKIFKQVACLGDRIKMFITIQ